jgi:hypothetical protein
MSDFTYETPNEEGFMKALLAKLKVEGFEEIAETLKGSKCEIVHNQQFAYPSGRWNAFRAEIIIRIPVSEYELAVKKVTGEIRNKIISIADDLMPKEAGLDVLSMSLSPCIEVTPVEESLLSDLQRVTETLSEGLTKEIFPKDIEEKGKEMADVYVYLYCIENALRLFLEKIAKENYGDDYFSNLNTSNDVNKKLNVRKRDEEKNQWLRIRGDSEIFYLDFDDIGYLIKNNWEIFKKYFPSQEWIVTKIIELSKCRNLVAHNSYIGKDERDLIRVYFNTILKQISSTIQY